MRRYCQSLLFGGLTSKLSYLIKIKNETLIDFFSKVSSLRVLKNHLLETIFGKLMILKRLNM